MALAKHEDMIEQFTPESADKRSAKAFMFGVRTAVRTTLCQQLRNRLAIRAPSLAS
jgi:hypothetical protein